MNKLNPIVHGLFQLAYYTGGGQYCPPALRIISAPEGGRNGQNTIISCFLYEMTFSWWEKNFARVTLRSPIGPLKIKISTKILDFVIKIQKNITPLFRPKSTKLTAYLLFRIVQRKLYQKMGQIGQEMTELCHFYRNFRNGPWRTQKFSKIEKFKKSPRAPKHFFWLIWCLFYMTS